MMTFGGWMTISNIVGPMMVYLDRFLIGSIISISAVAYYATPYEVVTKLWILPGALIGVLFPAFSTSVAANRDRAALLFDRSLHYCLLMLFPVVLVIMAFSEEALTVWLGVDFAINSTRVLQLLALGVFINSLARIPFAMVQSCGRPDLVAKAHLVELPFYLGALWLVLPVYGINGVATVWVARIAVDAIVFFIMCRHLLPQTILTIYRIGFALAVTTAILLVTFLLTAHLEKAAYVLFVSVGFLVVAWLKILTHRERTTILDLGRRCLPRP
jgi:O-antigen/teichoic acid export membrane protein